MPVVVVVVVVVAGGKRGGRVFYMRDGKPRW